jgi:hypothetical protein
MSYETLKAEYDALTATIQKAMREKDRDTQRIANAQRYEISLKMKVLQEEKVAESQEVVEEIVAEVVADAVAEAVVAEAVEEPKAAEVVVADAVADAVVAVAVEEPKAAEVVVADAVAEPKVSEEEVRAMIEKTTQEYEETRLQIDELNSQHVKTLMTGDMIAGFRIQGQIRALTEILEQRQCAMEATKLKFGH